MIYKTLQSFKQPNLRSQFCGDQKKLCLAFLAPHNPEGWARGGRHSNASAPAVARVPFATHGAEMTGVGTTAEAWNWFKVMKRRSVFLWDQATSENTNCSLFPTETWSVPLFFILLFSCLETKTYLYYYPWVFHLTKCHQAVCSKFLKWRG